MFDTKNVGKKIAKLRKEINMTQLELADEIGVSYQAVSNWERGNSMPDIAKLQDLSRILNTSIEDILDHTKEGKMVDEISKGNGMEYIKENKTNIKEYSYVAPVIKPKDNEEFLSHILKEQKGKVLISDLISIAPFVEEDVFRSFIDDLDMNDISQLIGLAPFLSDELLKDIVVRFLKENKISDINKLAGLAPFLDDDTLELIVDSFLSSGKGVDLNKIISLAPFLGEDAIGKLTRVVVRESGIKNITCIAPFLEENQLDELVEEWISSSGDKLNVQEIMGLFPFLEDDTLHRLSKVMVDKCGISALKYIAPFL